jgi:hypothetical protein
MKRIQSFLVQCMPNRTPREARFICDPTSANPRINIDYTATNMSPPFCTFRLTWPTSAAGINAHVFLRLFCSDADTCSLSFLRSGYQSWCSVDAAVPFPSWKPYTKCAWAYSALVNRAIAFRCYHHVAIGSNVSRWSYEPHLVTLWTIIITIRRYKKSN